MASGFDACFHHEVNGAKTTRTHDPLIAQERGDRFDDFMMNFDWDKFYWSDPLIGVDLTYAGTDGISPAQEMFVSLCEKQQQEQEQEEKNTKNKKNKNKNVNNNKVKKTSKKQEQE